MPHSEHWQPYVRVDHHCLKHIVSVILDSDIVVQADRAFIMKCKYLITDAEFSLHTQCCLSCSSAGLVQSR